MNATFEDDERGACGCSACAIWPLGGSVWPAMDVTRPTRAAVFSRFAAPGALGPVADLTEPVEIYLSVGEADTSGLSCDPGNQATCGLYRVTWDLMSMTALSVEEVVPRSGNTGAIQAAVAPLGRSIAFIAREDDGTGTATSATLRVVRRDGSAAVDIDSGTAGGDRPQFPNFYARGDLLYHKSTSSVPGDLWRAYGPWRGSVSSEDWLGNTGGVHDPVADFSWKDVNTHESPNYDPSASGVPLIVTFGGTFSAGEQVPTVSEVDGTNRVAFRLGQNTSGSSIDECHHPAWNITGNRILCTAQSRSSTRTDGTARALYEYGYDTSASEWVQVSTTPLFVPPSNADLAAALPAFAGIDCDILTYKYAEWCGSDDYVVMTIYCEADGLVTASRVVIGDLRTGELHDVTSAVVSDFFPSASRVGGVYSTCYSMRMSPGA